MKNEWEKLAEKFLFKFGRRILGKDSGGMIVRLKQALGIDAAWNALELAADTADPREYLGATIRNHQPAKIQVSDEDFARLKAKYDAKIKKTA